jgi:hypothetical protein
MAKTHDVLDYFTLVNGIVCWRSAEEIAAVSERRGLRMKRTPYGDEAGYGTPVFARGRLVRCRGSNYLSGDIGYALANGYAWPWETGAAGWVKPDVGEAWRFARRMERLIAAVALEGNRLVWRVDVRRGTYPAGSPIVGAPVWRGTEARVVQVDGVSYLMDDVVTFLSTGCWPWDEAGIWD